MSLFPLQYACEFLMNAFGLQHMEIQAASQMAEKRSIHMQTLLTDMLFREAPACIVTQSPNIMDLVKCDGDALFYDAMGLSIDNLVDAGYPRAALLGDAICGMAAARIFTRNFVFWFRSHVAKEIKWGGAKQNPDEKDDGGKMRPRSLFNAFIEITKCKSMPWEAAEINVIHFLQIIMRDSFQESEDSGCKPGVNSDPEGEQVDEISLMAAEMARLIETSVAPILGIDSSGLINGWNCKICELTGLELLEVLGKSLVLDVVHENSRIKDKNVEIQLKKFEANAPNSVVYVLVNACTSWDYRNNVVGACFVGQDITAEKTVTTNIIRMQECGHGKADGLDEARDNLKSLCVYDDQMKLQLALSDFLLCVVDYAPSPDGWVEMDVSSQFKRMADPGQGLPHSLIGDMFGAESNCMTQEGMALNISQMLVGMMKGGYSSKTSDHSGVEKSVTQSPIRTTRVTRPGGMVCHKLPGRHMEIQAASQMAEKRSIHMQTLLTDMLFREAPACIVTQSPNIMDLVKCDGDALFYDAMGLSTDNLIDAGYPRAALFGDAICGMAAARIFTRNFVFWFRSRCKGNQVGSKSMPWEAAEINAIHFLQIIMRDSFQESEDSGCKPGVNSDPEVAPILGNDSSGLINGWNSKICELTGLELLEVLGKSLVLDVVHENSRIEDKNVEIQLKKFEANAPNSVVYLLVNACTSWDYRNNVVGACFVGQDITAEKAVTTNIIRMQGDYKAIIQSVNNVIPPIFTSDENARCSEWNAVMEKLTGWMRHEIISLCVYDDQMKLQLALSDFLLCVVDYAPSPDGWVEMGMADPGQGLPHSLIGDMFGTESNCMTQEGMALNISHMLVGMMKVGYSSKTSDHSGSGFGVEKIVTQSPIRTTRVTRPGGMVCHKLPGRVSLPGSFTPSTRHPGGVVIDALQQEIKWGGAKQNPEEKDDGGKMRPRSLFNAFLEIMKSKSMPWEAAEINAIHFLQIIMRDSFQESEDSGCKPGVNSDPKGEQVDEISLMAAEMVRLIETSVAPILGIDSSGLINGWDSKICELTGLELLVVIGKSLVLDVDHENSRDVV
ncbi:hypothetical protein SASPL_111839 [Salvia splendens]|uniref:PAS domain-containing protein n=1 Tax=Salvia splendens TaxID=180675 RepID=A0A8X8YDA3_SALSN|nr:hypothetical protein SASPL_111839 [Salvia splendens]